MIHVTFSIKKNDTRCLCKHIILILIINICLLKKFMQTYLAFLVLSLKRIKKIIASIIFYVVITKFILVDFLSKFILVDRFRLAMILK